MLMEDWVDVQLRKEDGGVVGPRGDLLWFSAVYPQLEEGRGSYRVSSLSHPTLKVYLCDLPPRPPIWRCVQTEHEAEFGRGAIQVTASARSSCSFCFLLHFPCHVPTLSCYFRSSHSFLPCSNPASGRSHHLLTCSLVLQYINQPISTLSLPDCLVCSHPECPPDFPVAVGLVTFLLYCDYYRLISRFIDLSLNIEVWYLFTTPED